MTPVLFAGPSLQGVWHLVPPGIRCLPPATAGDIARAVRDGTRGIGLVDGCFGETRSVWHKEILLALSLGIPVLGAASMGALRAAECAAYGMQPVGRIADDYLTGRRVADADVALLHAPAEVGHAPLTLALVDAEEALAGLRAAGGLSARWQARLLAAARRLHFTQRTWPRVLAAGGWPLARHAPLLRAIDALGPGLKTRDALLLAQALPGAVAPPLRPAASVTGQFLALVRPGGTAA